MSRRAFALGLSMLSLVAPGNAPAQTERTIKVSIGLTSDHLQGQAMMKFAESVAQQSGGKLVVQLFPGGLSIAGLKDFGLIDLPFLFKSGEEAAAG
jgi:TRAP-type C4-dicarboxylate transport system substrate-binding protein